MKKYLICLIYSLFLIITTGCATDTNDTLNNQIQHQANWVGVYEGFFPQEQLRVQVKLNEDNTYDLVYFEKGNVKTYVKNSGRISWSNDKKIIGFFGYSKAVEFYVADNELYLKTFGDRTFDKKDIVFKKINSD